MLLFFSLHDFLVQSVEDRKTNNMTIMNRHSFITCCSTAYATENASLYTDELSFEEILYHSHTESLESCKESRSIVEYRNVVLQIDLQMVADNDTKCA